MEKKLSKKQLRHRDRLVHCHVMTHEEFIKAIDMLHSGDTEMRSLGQVLLRNARIEYKKLKKLS